MHAQPLSTHLSTVQLPKQCSCHMLPLLHPTKTCGLTPDQAELGRRRPFPPQRCISPSRNKNITDTQIPHAPNSTLTRSRYPHTSDSTKKAAEPPTQRPKKTVCARTLHTRDSLAAVWLGCSVARCHSHRTKSLLPRNSLLTVRCCWQSHTAPKCILAQDSASVRTHAPVRCFLKARMGWACTVIKMKLGCTVTAAHTGCVPLDTAAIMQAQSPSTKGVTTAQTDNL